MILEFLQRKVADSISDQSYDFRNRLSRLFIGKKELPLTEEERELKKVFKLSFKFAQGSETAQKRIFAYMFNKNPELFKDIIEHYKDKPPFFLRKIDLPRAHNTITASKYLEQINMFWGCMVEAQQQSRKDTDVPYDIDPLVRSLVKSELRAILRSKHISTRDAFGSVFYTHGIQKKSTGFDTFNTMFSEMIEPLKDMYLSEKKIVDNMGIDEYFTQKKDFYEGDALTHEEADVWELIYTWEKNHPGKSFWNE